MGRADGASKLSAKDLYGKSCPWTCRVCYSKGTSGDLEAAAREL